MVVRRRLDYKSSGLFFITTTVVDWLPIFQRSYLATAVPDRLSESSKTFNAPVVAYVLMPSHLHALVGLEDIRDLSQFMRSFKSLSSKDVRDCPEPQVTGKLTNGGRFALWQPRFDDLLVYSEEQFKIKVDYIHTNPVRAGLVSDPADYPYSSAKDWLLAGEGPITVDKSYSWVK